MAPEGGYMHMKTNRTPILLLPLAIILSSCIHDDYPTIMYTHGRDPISFRVSEEPATKSQDLTSTTITSFRVFGYYTQGAFNAATSTPDFMYNVQATGSNGAGFNYTPEKYWPSGTNNRLSFIAYAPSDASVTVTSVTRPGLPQLTYTTESDTENQKDFLVSAFVPDLTEPPGGQVTFQFSHILSSITFQAALTAGATQNITIKEISITSFKTAVYDMTTQSWGSHNNSGTTNLTLNQTVNSTTPAEIVGADFKLIPQALTNASISIRYRVQGENEDLTETIPASSIGTSWLQGNRYNYIISISDEVISLTVSPDTIVLGAENAANMTADISVASNANWTISSPPAWLSVSPMSGSGNTTVTLTALTSNTGSSERSTTLTISTTGISHNIYITQNYKITNETLQGIQDMGGKRYEDENVIVDLTAASDGIFGQYFTVWGTVNLTFEAKNGKKITNITFNYQRSPRSVTPDVGTYSGTSWTGNAEKVTLTVVAPTGLLSYAAIRGITISYD